MTSVQATVAPRERPAQELLICGLHLTRDAPERQVFMARTVLRPLVELGLLFASCLGLAGCSGAPEEGPGKTVPSVTVSYPLQREVTDYQDYTGRTAAVDSVQVQARVTGYLEKIYFTEGAEVKADTVLYEIDPRPYKAAYDAVKAQVAQNVAALELARQDNRRYK